MPLTPEEVQNKRFTVTRFRPGYDEEEVDAFLDEIVVELRRLGSGAGVTSSDRPVSAPAASAEAAGPAPVAPPPPPPPAAAPRPEEGQEAALRTLLLAQKTADEAVAQARAEAEQIVAEARQHAGDLQRQAQEQHETRVSALSRERQQLEAQVENLRGFEREFRNRLRSYLESQLHDLQEAPPLAPAGGPAPVGPGGRGGPGEPAPRGPSGPGGPAHGHGGPTAPSGAAVPPPGPGPVPVRGATRPSPPRLEEDLTPGADVAEGPPREAQPDIDEGDDPGRRS